MKSIDNVRTLCEDKASVGLQRTVELQGRINLPAEYREVLGIQIHEFVEIWYCTCNEIVIRRYGQKKRNKIRGALRKVSYNGQVCIPAEFRRWLGIVPGDKVEIFLYTSNEIRIKKIKYLEEL